MLPAPPARRGNRQLLLCGWTREGLIPDADQLSCTYHSHRRKFTAPPVFLDRMLEYASGRVWDDTNGLVAATARKAARSVTLLGGVRTLEARRCYSIRYRMPKKPVAEALIPATAIEHRIHTIRDHRVMLDADLAALYQVETFN